MFIKGDIGVQTIAHMCRHGYLDSGCPTCVGDGT